ncbi:MAG: ATP-dependent Clp protease ATP-binding subunit [Clostridiales bacterium]|nr:ATP-dependent Clp protease ATP-binding subunit [Clostridiales bacterium]
MLCCRCNKNLAVVYISKLEPDGSQKNEGYCLSCARELNLAPVDSILEKMGIEPEEMDRLNREMKGMLDEMGDDFDLGESINMLRSELGDVNDMLFDGDISEAEEYEEDEPADDTGTSSVMPSGDSDSDVIKEENMSRSRQRNPFEFMNRFMNNDNDEAAKAGPRRTKENKKRQKKKMLDTYGINLTTKARNGEIDAVIGRDKEIERTIQILNRRTKNNPCLIGEPGVGKTAIAEGLALKIINGEVPSKLMKYEIYLLDMTSVIAGTQFRGQFESRLRNIIEEVKKAGNIILVIDEIHTIASAGDAEGGMNAGNILKPALSKGEIQVIGATTIDEYRKYIEKDSALERRFQTVMVDEPTVEETIEILKGIKSYYEDYHKVKITDDIIRTASVLAERYIQDRFLPDKAIDVIDEAASKVNLENKELIELANIEQELEKIRAEKEEAASSDDYQKAADLKVQEIKLTSQLDELKKSSIKYLEADDVAAVIENWTKIPVKHISEYESERLVDLEERLHKGVIGQNEAVDAASAAIRRKRAGISLKRRPVSLIFVGPTGVGKTELAKQIAREVFDGEDALIRLDMSEYMEKHSVSKLIGSPPGYVGYDEAGQLTEKIRRKPYSVILLDEIEKAHQDVFNMLLQILDDGRITDSHGRVVSFENTIIIMTSNAGSDKKSNVVGFNEEDEASAIKIDRALKELFRPEFLNRVDETVIFKELKKDELIQIVDLMLNDLNDGLREKEITMEVTREAKEYVLENSYNKAYGARPMRRYIEKQIEDKLAQMIIKNEIRHGDKVKVGVKENNIFVEII